MPVLDSVERAKVRQYLGWSGRWAQFDSALARAFSALEAQTDETDLVRANLAELERIDTALTAAESRLKADQVGTIKLNRGELTSLCNRGRLFVGRIATTLGIEVREDAFAADAPRFRAGPWGAVGGGNQQRHG